MYIILSGILSVSAVVYVMLMIHRVVKIKGVEHLWEILLSRDTVFVETLTYIPLLMGILMSVVQFVPEMLQKRIKLTLHLPYNQRKMILLMLAFSVITLSLIFAAHIAFLWTYLHGILAQELTTRILITSLPWYVCGVLSYILTSWIILEPTWKKRILYFLLSAACIRIFFLSSVPESYNTFLPILITLTLSMLALPLLSVHRFKSGYQD